MIKVRPEIKRSITVNYIKFLSISLLGIKTVCFLLFFVLITVEAKAHPVIWKDGIVINSKFKKDSIELKTHYSVTNKWAVGIHSITLDGNHYGMFQNNYLFKRWNKSVSQGNFYFFSGLGADTTDRDSMITHMGFQADWETRKIYTYVSFDSYLKDEPIYILTSRMGVSPYLVEYDGLSSWIILQVDDIITKVSHEVSVMPVVRVFKKNILFEFGTNLTNYLLTTMIHI